MSHRAGSTWRWPRLRASHLGLVGILSRLAGRVENHAPSVARALVVGPAPAPVRARLIRLILARNAGTTWLSVQLDQLTFAIAAAAGEAALQNQPRLAALIGCIRKLRGEPVAVVGDSHSRLYVHRALKAGRWLFTIHHLASGASARGLANVASLSGQGTVVRQLMTALADQPISTIFVFGQVDVEFVFMFKRLGADPPRPFDPDEFSRFSKDVADRYLDYVGTLPGSDDARRWRLAAIFPPALSDQAWRNGYVNAHIAGLYSDMELETLRARLNQASVPTLQERTGHHAAFNAQLRDAAAARRIGLVDAFDSLVSSDRVVDPAFLGPEAGRNHHLCYPPVRTRVVEAIWRSLSP